MPPEGVCNHTPGGGRSGAIKGNRRQWTKFCALEISKHESFHTLRAGEGAWECKKTQMEAIMPLEGAHTWRGAITQILKT